MNAIGGPVGSSWREQILTRVAEQRSMLEWLLCERGTSDDQTATLRTAVVEHLDAARDAAQGGANIKKRTWMHASISGATLERASGHLDAVECDLLRLASNGYRQGQLPSLLAHVRRHLGPEDPRRMAVEQIANRAPEEPWQNLDAEHLLAALHAASSKARREVRQIRSFRNTLIATAGVLSIAAVAIAIVGWLAPSSVPLCFHPGQSVVCPTREISLTTIPPVPAPNQQQIDGYMRGAANPGDVALVELLGVLAAALAAAVALRNIKGTSGAYSLPVALAVLKLPTGALTAFLAIVLMRGEFVPGLSALDSSAQILAWALVFGYAQQILTQLVDRQAHTVLDNVRSGGTAPGAQPTDTSPAAATQPA